MHSCETGKQVFVWLLDEEWFISRKFAVYGKRVLLKPAGAQGSQGTHGTQGSQGPLVVQLSYY